MKILHIAKHGIASLTLAMTFVVAGCSTTAELRYPPVRWFRDTDTQRIAKPKAPEKGAAAPAREGSDYVAKIMALTEQLGSFSAFTTVSSRQESADTNNFDEIADSAWFTNRIGRFDLTPAEVALAGDPDAPNTKKPLTIIDSDLNAKNNTYFIRDSKGDEYLLRFDPPDYNEIASGAEVINSRILHAAGYNVPKSFILNVNPAQFKDAPSTRAIATKMPDGEPVGTFALTGRRKDDPNDRIAHEARRELRALRVFLAFLGRTDFRDSNTLDIFVSNDGERGFIKHYLSDLTHPFGTSAIGTKSRDYLHADPFVKAPVAERKAPFGFYQPENNTGEEIKEEFKPHKWRTRAFNPAFEYMTRRDAFWAAKIIARFSDERIAAIVTQAKYSDADLGKQITQTLIRRRDAIKEYWLTRVSPLDNFSMRQSGNDYVISFDNLAPDSGAHPYSYQYRMGTPHGKTSIAEWNESHGPAITLTGDDITGMKPEKIYKLEIQTRNPDNRAKISSVDVFLKNNGNLEMLGIRRRYVH